MLSELISELTAIDGTEVLTCLTGGLPELDRLADQWTDRPELRLVRLADGDDWLATWLEIASRVDWCLVIAPELGGALEQTLADLSHANPRLLNCRALALQLGCDKWAWSRWLLEHGWNHPLTFRWPDLPKQTPSAPKPEGRGGAAATSKDQAWVVKPSDGAGCLGLKRFHNWSAAVEYVTESWLPRDSSPAGRPLIQAWIDGETGSVAGFFDPAGSGQATWLCPVRQRLQENVCGELRYIGGEGPWRGPFEASLERLQRDLSRVPLDGASGWCGFDFVVPRDAPEQIIPIELNPRLTSSLGLYRQLYGRGFLAQLLDFVSQPSSAAHAKRASPLEGLPLGPPPCQTAQSFGRLRRVDGTANSWNWLVDASPLRWPAVD